jgi:hypothetical protein
MKKSAKLFLTSATLLFLFSCGKKTTKEFYFYQLKADGVSNNLKLYVDDVSRGLLPALANKIACDSTQLKSQTINLLLQTGKHTIYCKDSLGVIKISGYIKLRKNGSGVGGNLGGIESTSTNDNCYVIRLYE